MEKFNFNPFDKVLVRDNITQKWRPALYSFYDENCLTFPYRLIGGCSTYCIPYNDETAHLLGTTDDYKEPYVPKNGDFVRLKHEEGDEVLCIFKANIDNHPVDNNDDYDIYAAYFIASDHVKIDAIIRGLHVDAYTATEEEKQLLLSKLHEIGKKWNAEKKCIEDVWTPKDGDFVAWGDSDRPAISIFREGDKMHFPTYVSLYRNGDIGIDDINTIEKGYRLFRPATDTEKQQLLDALHKDGKDWDESKKEIVEYKWKPNTNDKYQYVNSALIVDSDCWTSDLLDEQRYRIGNCFRTREEAQAMADKFKELLKGK